MIDDKSALDRSVSVGWIEMNAVLLLRFARDQPLSFPYPPKLSCGTRIYPLLRALAQTATSRTPLQSQTPPPILLSLHHHRNPPSHLVALRRICPSSRTYLKRLAHRPLPRSSLYRVPIPLQLLRHPLSRRLLQPPVTIPLPNLCNWPILPQFRQFHFACRTVLSSSRPRSIWWASLPREV